MKFLRSEMKDNLSLIEISVARVSSFARVHVLIPWALIPTEWYKGKQMTTAHVVGFITGEDPWV